MSVARAFPGTVHARRQPDANAARQHWRAMAAAALGMAARAAATQGRQTLAGEDLRAALRLGVDLPALRGDAGARPVETAFRALAGAMLDAAAPERLAVLAEALAPTARAVEHLLDEEVAPYLRQANRIAGEREDD